MRKELLQAEDGKFWDIIPGTETDPLLCCKIRLLNESFGVCLPKDTQELPGETQGLTFTPTDSSSGTDNNFHSTDENGDVVIINLLAKTCDPPGTGFCSEYVSFDRLLF